MALAIIVLMVFVCWWSSLALLRHLKERRSLSQLPSPRSLPLLGHSLIIRPDPEGFFDQVNGMAAMFPSTPRLVVLWIGHQPSLMLYSAELFERVLNTSHHLDKGYMYTFLHPWLGRGLLTSDAERWRPRRKLLTPTFHYDILKDFARIFNQQAMILVENLSQYDGRVVEVGSLVTLCALDIICETSMGRSVGAQQNAESEYVRAVHEINDIIQSRQKNPLVWPDVLFHLIGRGRRHNWCLRVLHSFTAKVIAERRAELISGARRNGTRTAFLDLLLEMVDGGEMPLEDVQSEVDTFMFEGHDTTSTTLTWALHLIACDPDVQHRCQMEIDSVMGSHGDDLSVEQLGDVRYVEACIKETLRLFPPVPIYVRKLGRDTELAGTMVSAGTQILLNAMLVHRDPKHWPDPERFDPTRFMGDGSERRHPFAFVPFSAGSRNCIGQRFALMEVKTVLCHVLRHFHLEPMKRRDQVRAKAELIVRPLGGIELRLTRRV